MENKPTQEVEKENPTYSSSADLIFPQESWKERFDKEFEFSFNIGVTPDDITKEKIIAFISQVESDAYKRGLHEDCLQLDAEMADFLKDTGEKSKYIIDGIRENERSTLLTLLKSEVSAMKPVLYNENKDRHLENVAIYNTLDKVLSKLSNHETKP